MNLFLIDRVNSLFTYVYYYIILFKKLYFSIMRLEETVRLWCSSIWISSFEEEWMV